MLTFPDDATRRPVVGLLTVSFKMFDEQMPPGFRLQQDKSARRLAEGLREHFEVDHPGLVSNLQDAQSANDRFLSRHLDAVVFAPTMAAPPEFASVALEGVNAPVLLWNITATERLPSNLDQAAAHKDTRLLGATMYANVLVRRGLPLTVVTSPEADSTEVVRRLHGLLAGHRLRGSTALRLGDPIDGYLDVETTRQDLSEIGVVEVRPPKSSIRDAIMNVPARRIKEVREEVSARGWIGEIDDRSAQVVAGVADLVQQSDATVGTVNCHGPCFRDGEVGIVACLAVSVSTTAGVPMSCTGDLPTALAMKMGQMLAGAVLYGELYVLERQTGLFLFANSGEGDASWAAGDVVVRPTTHYPGRSGVGATVSFELPPGPATMMSMSPTQNGWRLGWALTEIVESRYAGLRAPNAMIRFLGHSDAELSATAWLKSGASHHAALVPGHLDLEIPEAAKALGIQEVAV